MKTVSFLSVILLNVAGCHKEPCNADPLDTPAATVAVQGPSSGSINADISFAVTVPLTDGCQQFNSFRTEQVVNDTFYIRPYVRSTTVPCEETVCPQVYGEVVQNFIFKKETAGTYHLRFLKNFNEAAIEKIITLN